MKEKFKKITALLVAVSVIFAYTSVINAEENVTDTEEVQYSEAYGLIAAISNAENYMPYEAETPVTRAQFLQAVIASANITDVGGFDSAFNDVAVGTEVYATVSYALKNNIISASENFRPNDSITVDEAMKICLNAFGYGVKANALGGWPAGYRAAAAQAGLLSGIKSQGTLLAYDAYEMIFNMLNADNIELIFAEGELRYEVTSETILYANYDIWEVRGIVTSNEFTEIGSIKGSNKSVTELEATVGIDGVIYDAQKGAFNDLLGYKVRAYVRKSDSVNDYEAVYLKAHNNKTVTLNSGNLHYADGTLYDEDTKKEYKINRSVDTIVNRKADYSFNLSELDSFSGSVTLVSNNNTSDYNVLVITSYSYMLVSTFDKQKLIIKDMENKDKTVELTEESIVSVYLEDEGIYGTLGDITKSSFIACALSHDGELCDIIVMGRFAEGKVTGFSEETIMIEDTEYKISSVFAKSDLDKIKLGYVASFYIGLNDEIIATATTTNSMKYGYLLKADMKKRLSSKLQMKIFTANGEMKIFDCAEKIKLDGEMRDDLRNVCETYLTTPQVIKYSVNDEGLVNIIDLAETTRFYKDPDKEKFDIYNNLERNVLSGSYRHRGNNFSAYFFSNNAITMVIPPATADVEDDEKYAIGYSFGDDQILTDGTDIEVYDVGYDGNAKFIVAYVDSTDSANVPITGAQSVVIESVFNKRDSDGFFRQAIRGWSDGQFVEYFLDDTVSVKKFGADAELECGDVIRVLRNGDMVRALVVDIVGNQFIRNTGISMNFNPDLATNYYYRYGSAYSLYNGTVLLSKKDPEAEGFDYSIENMRGVKLPASIIVVDLKEKKLKVADENAINTYLNSAEDASCMVVKFNFANSGYCLIYEGLED